MLLNLLKYGYVNYYKRYNSSRVDKKCLDIYENKENIKCKKVNSFAIFWRIYTK